MVTKEDVHNAQAAWGKAIVAIGRHKSVRSKCEEVASEQVDKLYAYGRNEVLFKPTRAAETPFRPGREGALSYFIGGNDRFPEDQGFAMQPWTAVRFENAGIILEEKRALAMGHYFFTDEEGKEEKVEYTFGYCRTGDGSLKIDLHHSSLPYDG